MFNNKSTMLTTGWFISIYLLLLQYAIPLTQAQTSSISGYAFFDSSSDGIKDPTNTLDYGIYDISVWLFNCQDEILKTTKTNNAGYYSFEGIDSMSLDTAPFGYYIYASVPKWYVVTETWNGAQDPSSGELLYPNVDSSVNPQTGRTNCFEVDDGDNVEIDFGLNFYVEPTPPDTPQRPPAVEPTPATRPPLTTTNAPTASKVTSNPTKQPVVVAPVPATRPPIQAVTANPTNKPTIPSVVIPATPPPVLSTLKPTPSPTKETAKPVTTASPINSPTTSSPVKSPTTTSPTKVPTIRVGTTITNSTLKQLSMTIAGITSIEDTNSWSELTKLHIECYYNGCNNDIHGVWDVTVDLEVVDVVSSTEQKKVRSLPWDQQQDEAVEGTRRQLQETEYVQIIYNQVSTYTTSDPILYDDLYVATNPFTQETSQDEYIASLKTADNSVYDDVTSIISVRQLPSQGSSVPVLGGDVDKQPPPPANTDSAETDNNSNNNNNEGDGDGGSNNTAIIVAVVVCLVIVIVASAVIVKYRRMSQQNAYSGEPVGNGPKSSMRQFDSGDLEHGNSNGGGGGGDSGTYSNGFGSSSSMSRRSSSSRFPGMTTFDESAFEHLTLRGSSHSEKMIQIIAPPGKLGVVVDTPPSGGCAYVCEIKNTCPIRNEIQLEDRIIAVDRDDVQKMSAVDVSKLLAKRSRNEERKITVLRRVKGPNDSIASSQPKGGSGSMFGSVADSLTSSAAAPQAPPISSSSKDKEVLMDVTAPAGKLGVVLVTPEPPETGPAYVFKIRDDSPLVNKLLLGDKVLAVDDEDVRGMTAINVSKLLGSKSGQESRKISIKRVVDISAGGGVEVTPNDTTPAPTTSSGGFDINTPGEIFEIIAPPGKLGIVVDSPPEGGCAFVSDIKQECPIKTRIKLGDKLIKVDDEDVSTLKAVHVSSKLSILQFVLYQ